MAESKSAALPLGYAPSGQPDRDGARAPGDSGTATVVYRARRSISTAAPQEICAAPG
ncbi:hypothetical protein BRAO375_4180006 [Bradyrhizobium sp. ORS 375]|nr:hypothetical protein BRAO375_4180006 [Bradyrhizobium sp. ORS 375]